MKTGTKLHFFNKDYGTIIEYFIGGSYKSSEQEFGILRDGVTYTITKEDSQYVTTTQLNANTYKHTILPIFDLYSLKQNLEARCSIIKGDAPYNIRLGIPLGLPVQDTKLSILNTINTTFGVKSCQVLQNYIKDRKYVMDIKVHSNLGDVVITI